ncbi:hypothetical protein [Saccharopolyspora rosea]|uniref:hypothetical protein n=1 Tax=Saccharopolyspora rosea TaxID=524884 RepID=UPI0021DAB5D7|nr:hypothetical protein [Saccharopolyspora rosea]
MDDRNHDGPHVDQIPPEIFDDEFVDYWITREWVQFHTAGGDPFAELSEWESARYFELP